MASSAVRVSRYLLAMLVLSSLLTSPSAAGDTYYEPTPDAMRFAFSGDAPFSDYLETTQDWLMQHRVFIRPDQKQRELKLIMPFELPVPDRCTRPTRGMLLVHGILDTPYGVRDLAEALNAECFLVRAILLPGHGTRPGDLLTVTSDDWLAAVRYGVRSLKQDADTVYAGGFSLGGLLATHAALDDPDIRAVVLLAPALRVTYQLLADQSTWLRHLKDWLDQNPAPLPVRYQSMATNAVAQVIELIDRYDAKVDDGFDTPAYVVSSVADIAVQGEKLIDEFLEHFVNEQSRLEVYGEHDIDPGLRVSLRSGFVPEEEILNIAHVAIPYRRDDFYFGENGAYRDCGQYLPIMPGDEVAGCARAERNWKGELGSTDDERYLPLQRLTYNPYFDDTMKNIIDFLNGLKETAQ